VNGIDCIYCLLSFLKEINKSKLYNHIQIYKYIYNILRNILYIYNIYSHIYTIYILVHNTCISFTMLKPLCKFLKIVSLTRLYKRKTKEKILVL